MRISDWSSDVCSSDLTVARQRGYSGSAETIRPAHDPKPSGAKPARSHRAEKLTSSPSSRKVRVSPLGSVRGNSPILHNSNMLQKISRLGPDIVPETTRSPGQRLVPTQLICVNIRPKVQ